MAAAARRPPTCVPSSEQRRDEIATLPLSGEALRIIQALQGKLKQTKQQLAQTHQAAKEAAELAEQRRMQSQTHLEKEQQAARIVDRLQKERGKGTSYQRLLAEQLQEAQERLRVAQEEREHAVSREDYDILASENHNLVDQLTEAHSERTQLQQRNEHLAARLRTRSPPPESEKIERTPRRAPVAEGSLQRSPSGGPRPPAIAFLQRQVAELRASEEHLTTQFRTACEHATSLERRMETIRSRNRQLELQLKRTQESASEREQELRDAGQRQAQQIRVLLELVNGPFAEEMSISGDGTRLSAGVTQPALSPASPSSDAAPPVYRRPGPPPYWQRVASVSMNNISPIGTPLPDGDPDSSGGLGTDALVDGTFSAKAHVDARAQGSIGSMATAPTSRDGSPRRLLGTMQLFADKSSEHVTADSAHWPCNQGDSARQRTSRSGSPQDSRRDFGDTRTSLRVRAQSSSLRPPIRRALVIGINYFQHGDGRLSGTVDGSEAFVGVLRSVLGFQDSQIKHLCDDRADMLPTRSNILEGCRWLVHDAGPGDEMFLHFSGHGSQLKDGSCDGSAISPCDFQAAGQIAGDEIHSILVRGLPSGCRLWLLMDCCYINSALDLRHKVTAALDGQSATFSETDTHFVSSESIVDIIQISGCKDARPRSKDIPGGIRGSLEAGALTAAFGRCVTPTISCYELLLRMRDYLHSNGFSQVPQMSSDRLVCLDSTFSRYSSQAAGPAQLPVSCLPRDGRENAPRRVSAREVDILASLGAVREKAATGELRSEADMVLSPRLSHFGEDDGRRAAATGGPELPARVLQGSTGSCGTLHRSEADGESGHSPAPSLAVAMPSAPVSARGGEAERGPKASAWDAGVSSYKRLIEEMAQRS